MIAERDFAGSFCIFSILPRKCFGDLRSANLSGQSVSFRSTASTEEICIVALHAGTQDTLHLCDAVECKLPAEDWFESNNKIQKKA